MEHERTSPDESKAHLKSTLDVILENSVKELERLREKLADNPKELKEKERKFIFNETAKLENLSSLQVRLDEYREASGNLSPKQKADKAKATNNSTTLGDHLRAIGKFKPNANWQAHHIVCSKHASHAAARFKLFAYLGINDPVNGCWLPRKHRYAVGTPHPHAVGHAYLHTTEYAKWIRTEVVKANSKQAITHSLRDVQLKLHYAPDLPDSILTDKGKEDLRTRS